MLRKSIQPRQGTGLGALSVLALVISGFALVLAFPQSNAYALTQKVYDTVAEFNRGTLYHTGLTADVANGGDGNGEVRLLNVGINPATWNKGGGNHTGLPGRWGHSGAQQGGRIYISGGNTSPLASTALNTVHYSTIQPGHNLSNWNPVSKLPGKRYLHAMVALNGYVYVLGGLNETAVPQSTVFKAQINSDGTLGSWTTTASLPVAVSDLTAVTISDSIFVLGGQDENGDATDAVYFAAPDGSGDIGSWSSGTALPRAVSRHAAAASSTSIYLAGGAKFSPQTFFPNVSFGSGTSNWQETDLLPVSLVYAAGVQYSGELYIVGGAFNNGSTLENNIRTNLINQDHSLVVSGWTSSNVLSAPRQRTAAVVSNDGWIYVIQGQSGNLATGGSALETIDYGPSVSAGGGRFAPSGTYTSERVDLGSSRNIQSIVFNTSRDSSTSMSFEYRASDLSNFSDTTYQSAGSPNAGNNVITTKTINITRRYVQFRVNLTASPLEDKSPNLNVVTINYDAPGTPTPSRTKTKVPPTNTPTNTSTPTNTRTPTATATRTETRTRTPTVTQTKTPKTVTRTATSTRTTTSTRTATPSPTLPCGGKLGKTQQYAPNDRSKLKKARVLLAWSNVDCATRYKIVIRLGDKKGQRVFSSKVTTLELQTKPLVKGKRYVWRVKACNSLTCGEASGWWKFTLIK